MAEDKKQGGGGGGGSENDSKAFLFLFIAVLAVAALIPTLIAVGLYMLLRRVLNRKESLLVLLTGIVGVGMNPGAIFADYGRWLVALVSGDRFVDGASRLDVPWLSLLFLGFLFAGLALSLRESRLADLGMTRIGRKKATVTRVMEQKFGKGIYSQETVLPTVSEKKHAVKVVAPGGSLTIDPMAHSLKSNQPAGKRDFPIAVDKRGRPILLNEGEIGMHTLIFGSTGSGKSKTIEAFAGGLLDLGWDGMIVDLKEDTKPGGLRDWCYEYANHHSKPYQELRLSNMDSEYWFNPLAGMGPDEMRDTILSLNEFEAAYWEAINKKMLGQVINLFMDAHAVDPMAFPFPTMLDIGRFLASPSLPTAGKKMCATVLAAVPARSRDDYQTILQPTKDEQTSGAGLGAKLTLIYDTAVGRHVLQAGNGRREVDVTMSGLTYVGLDSQGKPDLTRIISSALLQRMSVYSSQRTTGANSRKTPPPRFIIIDEANWVDKLIVQNLLSRARSAGLAIVLATQGPLDWISPKEGDMFATLSQNTNVCIAMSQGEPESAERLAEYIGKKKMMQNMHRVVGDELQEMGSARLMEDYIVQPDDLRRMGIGEAIIRVGKPAERIVWASVRMRDPRSGPGARTR